MAQVRSNFRDLIFAVVLLSALSFSSAHAQKYYLESLQPPEAGQFMFSLHTGMTPNISSGSSWIDSKYTPAMPFKNNYLSAGLPDRSNGAYDIGGTISYYAPESHFAPYINIRYSDVNQAYGANPALFQIGILALGGEYDFIPSHDTRIYTRIGASANLISGIVNESTAAEASVDKNIIPTGRAGLELSAGAFTRIPSSILTLGADISYENVNILGKSYNTAGPRLNDAQNPTDQSTKPRPIDFFLFDVSIGVRM